MTQLRSGGLSKESESKLKRGEALSQLLMQPKNRPRSVAEQIFCLIALSRGALDLFSAAQIRKFREEIVEFVRAQDPKIVEELETTKKMTEENKNRIIECFKKYFEAVG